MKSANRKYWNLISNAKASAFACPHAAGQLWRDKQMSNEIPMSKKEVNGDQ
jgi:hypothetical protein